MLKRFLMVISGLVLLSSGVFAQSSVSSDTVQTRKKHTDQDFKAKASTKAQKSAKNTASTSSKLASKSTTNAQKSATKPSKEALAASKKKGKKSSKSATIA